MNRLPPVTSWLVLLTATVGATQLNRTTDSFDSSASRPASRELVRRPFGETSIAAATVDGVLYERVWTRMRGTSEHAITDERKAYEDEHGEKTLLGLREMGVNLVVIPYGGSGPAEKDAEERRVAADFAELARRNGFHVGLRLPVTTANPRHWAAASQPIDDRAILSAVGKPVSSARNGWNLLNLAHPATRAHARTMIEQALRDVRPDVVFLPESTTGAGYEAFTQREFAVFVKQSRKTGESIGPAIAPTDAQDRSNPAQAVAPITPPQPAEADSARIRPWIQFRVAAAMNFVGFVRAALTTGGCAPPLGVEAAPTLNVPAIDAGPVVDLNAIAVHASILWSSSGVRCASDGLVTHGIADLKAAVHAGLDVVPASPTAIDVAQSLVYCGNAGCIAHFHYGFITADIMGRSFVDESMVALARFGEAHPAWFRNVRRPADVVLWRPAPADLVGVPADAVEMARTESALVTHRIPFAVAVSEELPDLRPDQALVLAGTTRVSDTLLARIRRHIESGGGLLIIGTAGSQDLRGIDRAEPVSALWRGERDGHTSQSRDDSNADSTRHMVGTARIAEMSQPGPPWNIWLNARSARRGMATRPTPPHEDALFKTLQWIINRPFRVECPLRGGVVCELTESADGRNAILHILNYGAVLPIPESSPPVRASIAWPDRGVPVAIHRWRAADGASEPCEFELKNGRLQFEVARCDLYDLYVIQAE
jgi:hypothetical protein